MRPDAERPAPRPCPICGKQAREEHRPFCSRRCADIDLHRWMSGVYTVPVAEEEPPLLPGEADEE